MKTLECKKYALYFYLPFDAKVMINSGAVVKLDATVINGIGTRLNPILLLNPLSEITEEVTKQMGAEFIFGRAQPTSQEIIENRINTNTLYFNDAMILIKNHYDIFGLLADGQAIHKSAYKQ